MAIVVYYYHLLTINVNYSNYSSKWVSSLRNLIVYFILYSSRVFLICWSYTYQMLLLSLQFNVITVLSVIFNLFYSFSLHSSPQCRLGNFIESNISSPHSGELCRQTKTALPIRSSYWKSFVNNKFKHIVLSSTYILIQMILLVKNTFVQFFFLKGPHDRYFTLRHI